jgi:hypothetical protein
MYESERHRVVTDKEMKALLVLVLLLITAATALAYGSDVATGMSVVAAATPTIVITEPLAMLLSGGLLLVLAGAVRRLPE